MKNGVFMLCACYEQYRPPRLQLHVLRRTSLKSGVFLYCTPHITPPATPPTPTHTYYTHTSRILPLSPTYGTVHRRTYVIIVVKPCLLSFIHHTAHHFGLLFHCQSPFFNNHLRHEQTQHTPIGINCLARRRDDSPAGPGRRVRPVLAKA